VGLRFAERAESGSNSDVQREWLPQAKRIVIKLGTGLLTDGRKELDPAQMGRLVAQFAAQCRAQREVVLVTSGAVGAGMGLLGLNKRPTELAELQACAAAGQSRLMAAYEKLFSEYGLHTAQVPLTHEDLQNKERHRNARNTLTTLLRRVVVPIINENDAVSTTELKFGDNDRLSALVAALLPADLLIILTSVEGVIEHYGTASARTLPTVEHIGEALERMAGGTTSATAVGGMRSKIQAARIVVRSGIPLVIASGRKEGVLARIFAAEEEGTFFVPHSSGLRGRKRWIAFFHHPKGSLFLDEGAVEALCLKSKSLLPPGIKRCEGDFAAGDVVSLCRLDGTEFARGIARFSAADMRSWTQPRTEAIHRDDLVVL
jgi:glutamate 5-kinase